MANAACLSRLRREVEMLASGPPPGVSCWPRDDGASMQQLRAQIRGPEGSWYEEGTFELDVSVPDRYPFEPPQVRFVTPIFHPNIDDGGRICLDTLKTGPHGAWAPSVSVPTLLTSIRLLMAHPTPTTAHARDHRALPARPRASPRRRARARARARDGRRRRRARGAGARRARRRHCARRDGRGRRARGRVRAARDGRGRAPRAGPRRARRRGREEKRAEPDEGM